MLRKPHKLRVVALGSTFCVLAALVGGRLYDLQVRQHEHYTERADRQQTKNFVIQAERGEIVDRTGRPLATSIGTLSIYVSPKYFRAPEADVDLTGLSHQIGYFTGLPANVIEARLQGNVVTNLGRQLDPEVANKVATLFDDYEISRRGFWFHRESKRQYPRALAPHVIGWCGTDPDGDNRGQAALELRYNDEISGQRIEGKTSRTGLSQAMQPLPPDQILAARGSTLVLTIDAAIQEATEAAVAESALEFEADACGAIVMDVDTGAILAMASWPTFDNGAYGEYEAEQRRNRILTDPIETGSVAKLFTAAMLLDTGKVSLNTMIDCEGGRAVIGPRTIKDAPGHTLHVAPFYEVIRYSSNVGTVKAAQALENEEWYGYLRRFGLGERTGIDLPGEGSGILYPTSKWTSYSRTSLPMGYEMALTPMQIVTGIAALVNGGELLQPYVVREMQDSKGHVLWRHERVVRHRVVRPATSVLLREVMEDVVVHGTGEAARVPGYRIGGKTGTTRKSHILTHREYIASFAGALPMDDPRVAIYCFVDNPHGAYYASTVAAPMFRKIAEASILHLGILPSEPIETPLVAEGSVPFIGRQQSVAETVTDPLYPGVPDFAGLSMAQVRQQMPPMIANVRFVGTGRVADQTPLPGERYDASTEIVLVFSTDVPSAAAFAPAAIASAQETSR
jgi:cell division protein FtsI (penicillin-binding protein 3)